MSNQYYPFQQQFQVPPQRSSYSPIHNNQYVPYQHMPYLSIPIQQPQLMQQPLQQSSFAPHCFPPNSQPMMPLDRQLMPLTKQTSIPRSQYPLTQWSAVYVNHKFQNDDSNISCPMNNQHAHLLQPIPKTQCTLDTDLENETIALVESITENDEQKRDEITSRKWKKEKEKTEKISYYKEITNLKDDKQIREILEKHNWDVERAITSEFKSSPNLQPVRDDHNLNNLKINLNENCFYDNEYNHYNNNSKLTLKVTLPDRRQFSYQLSIDETFWTVYSCLVRSAPELTQKQFTFQLSNGHQMKEIEFDQTLKQSKLISNSELKIIY